MDLGNGAVGRYVQFDEAANPRFSELTEGDTQDYAWDFLQISGYSPAVELENPYWPGPMPVEDYTSLQGALVLCTLRDDGSWVKSRAVFDVTALSVIPEPISFVLIALAISCAVAAERRRFAQQ